VFYRNQEGDPENSFQRAQFQVDFQSDDQFVVFVDRSFERIPEVFPIFHSIVIPPGNYSWVDGGARLITKPGRRLTAELQGIGGSFYDGSHFETSATVSWKINKHLTVEQAFISDGVHLPAGDFRTNLLRSRISFSWNTSFSVDTLAQYDNDSDQFGINLRVGYIFREGTELFFVFNEITDPPVITPYLQERVHSRSALLKFTYLFQF
jgi:hypothetical protein